MRDRNETLESLEAKMAVWHCWWHINGDHLECVDCKACQWPWNSAAPFRHENDCASAAKAPTYPWHDLARIIR